MPLPILPTESLDSLPTAYRPIFEMATLEKVIPPGADSSHRVSLYRLNDGTLRRVEEHLRDDGSVRVVPMDAASVLVRTANEKEFAENVPAAELISPGLFHLDFRELPEIYEQFVNSASLTAAFNVFAQNLPARVGVQSDAISVLSVEENYSLAIPRLKRLGPCDRQWAIGNADGAIHLAGAHELTRGRREVVVAILDNGILREHVEFIGALEDGRLLMLEGGNVLSGVPADASSGDHGTGCASVVLAQGVRILGVAPDCSLLPVKVKDCAKDVLNSDVLKGIEFALAQHAKIISISMEVPDATDELRRVIERQRETLFVVAAGNDNHDLEDPRYQVYPVCYALPNMISVIACMESGGIYRKTNFATDERAHVAAPGVSVCHCDIDHVLAYTKMDGTSIAAPHVAGIAALIWSAVPDATVAEVKQWILDTAVYQPELRNRCLTKGRVDATRAVQAAVASRRAGGNGPNPCPPGDGR